MKLVIVICTFGSLKKYSISNILVLFHQLKITTFDEF